MSLGAVSSVALGLILVYSLLGILTSAAQELITGWLGTRANSLGARLKQLLADGNSTMKLPRNFFQKAFQVLTGKSGPGSLSPLASKVLSSGILSAPSARGPASYVKPEIFAQAVVAALERLHDDQSLGKTNLKDKVSAAIKDLADGGAKSALIAFLSQANDDLDTFKKSIVAWFDEGMDRLNGIYSRWSKLFAVLTGLFVAVTLNVDTLTLTRALNNMTPAQQALLEKIAEAAVAENAAAAEEGKELTQQRARALLDEAALPIGWPAKTSLFTWRSGRSVGEIPAPSWPNGWMSLPGWILTAVAISLGSSFWFELLARFVNIRTTGPKPKKPEEA
jgi:hypothetical protein